MENIYKPSDFFCTDLMAVDEHFRDFSTLVLETNAGAPTLKANVTHLLGDVKQSVFNELQRTCSVDKLKCDKEVGPVELPDTILSQHKLHIQPYPVTAVSTRNLKTVETRERFKDDPENYSKYRHVIRQEFETNIMQRDVSSKPHTLRPLKDTLYTVRVYHPFFFKFVKKNYHKNCKYSHEIVALGSNTLADVRDKILCKCDIGICQETEIPGVNVNLPSGVAARDVYPSNFLFIENTFYNDFRHANAIDYSAVVTKWAEKYKVGTFKTALSQQKKLSDLKIRLGYPYLYQHQADCEHIVVFTEVRLLKTADFLCKKDYPYYKSVARYSSKLCVICGLSTARWICVGSARLPFDNAFLCQECCVAYNYVDCAKVDDVRIYPYFDRATVL